MSGCSVTSPRTGEDGFSLIEAVMASFVLVLLFAGFGKSMGTSYSGSRDNAAAQEATAVAVEQIEFVRSLGWADIAMPYVPESDPMVDSTNGMLLADEADIEQDEPLHVDTGGLVHPEDIETVDGVSYTIRRYVSVTPDGLRRIIALVTWEVEGVVTSYRTSTLVSEVSTR